MLLPCTSLVQCSFDVGCMDSRKRTGIKRRDLGFGLTAWLNAGKLK